MSDPTGLTLASPFEHLMELLGQQKPDAAIRTHLRHNGFEAYDDVCCLTDTDLDELTVPKDGGGEKPLYKAGRAKLAKFIKWAAMPGHDADKLLTYTSFATLINDTKQDMSSMSSHASSSQASSHMSSSSQFSYASNHDAVNDFNKGIKLDIKAFPKLEERTYYHEWKKKFAVIAKMQRLGNVLDENYTPRDAEENALFESQQSYMCGDYRRFS